MRDPSSTDHGTAVAAVADAPRARALFVAPDPELGFVAQDLRILGERYELETVFRRDHPSRRSLLAAVVRKLWRQRPALLYVWFAEPYDSPYILLLGRLSGVRSALVAGGYDATSIPEIGYGLIRQRDRWAVRRALRLANVVLPFSDFSAAEILRLTRPRRMRVLYPGVDLDHFRPDGAPKERLVVTVGTVASGVWRRKGLDLFARCARLLPDTRFVIVGRCVDREVADELQRLGGPNLVLTGRRASAEELLLWYQRAAVYAQLSAHEGFGLALAEGMACECVPVGTKLGSLPEVIGEAGALVARRDPEEIAPSIRWALGCGLGPRARMRIAGLYPLTRRQRELTEILDRLLE